MNYFEWFSLPISFQPNQAQLKQQFYALSKTVHPDFYINESEEKQAEILHQSTLTNKAYQTLSNPEKCLPYVLELKGMLTEGESYTLPQDFLMEMMEVNEALMDLEFEPDTQRLAALSLEVAEIEQHLKQELTQLTQHFDRLLGENEEDTLLKIKAAYFRQKYVLRIRDSLNRFASR